MLGLSLLLVLGSCLGTLSLPANSTLGTRIVGGSAAAIEAFPYIASIQKYGKHMCGGSIINSRTVLTAAHCVSGERASALRVHVGSKLTTLREGQLFSVDDIHQHGRYSASGLDYDIGLLRLSRALLYSSTIRPISLPASGERLVDGVYGSIAGWGLKNPNDSKGADTLQFAIVPVINQDTCDRLIGGGHLTERMFCAGFLQGGVDSCKMDSGGPLTTQGKLIGITSWGDGCAKRNKPGVYVRVSTFVPWIKNILWKNYRERI